MKSRWQTTSDSGAIQNPEKAGSCPIAPCCFPWIGLLAHSVDLHRWANGGAIQTGEKAGDRWTGAICEPPLIGIFDKKSTNP